ncbi:hypothetical protein [Rhodococcus sp. 14-2470-1a]|uniref:hypothetical protein n=1 Tax=Rhodococcus sp. 14-2470-1a TaxID=2023150 RepID=UPI0015C62DDF|nr:hypothetical protein [Rhodococcus sp. 14-2470-1a]
MPGPASSSEAGTATAIGILDKNKRRSVIAEILLEKDDRDSTGARWGDMLE